ncbi:hypothetical protein T459_30113 [Capsicum annuum]|uniref:MICOS complex subunit MIC60 n=1 Tax=Capsicum annuum TaxID=4072 RepID=A0A2G2Y7H1_CAPAN|nr:hypothetical protein T459_30113 [Capsicum annuum]
MVWSRDEKGPQSVDVRGWPWRVSSGVGVDQKMYWRGVIRRDMEQLQLSEDMTLDRKFDTLKGTLRHFSLIPPGGGGILTHSLASVTSWLKVKEADLSGDGIESLINRVESFLAQGKLSEAADTLEKGLKETNAAAVADDWVKRARNRAITEQALTLLQSYATTISIT